MKEESVIVDCTGARLDQFLARKYPGYSRSHLKELILRGDVRVNGSARPPDFRLSGGEVIRLRVAQPSWAELPFERWILYEDRDLLVLHKPAGILTHPMGESWISRPQAALADADANLAGLLLKRRPEVVSEGMSRCGIVHRLDRQTSGVMLAAKTPAAQERLLAAFKDREVQKIYRALVLGEIRKTTVEAPIGRRPGSRKVQVTPWGKAASTEFKALASARGVTLVQAEPLTGRTHQIRAHLALLEHPVLGDPDWFRAPEAAKLKALGVPAPSRMMLHAYRIQFSHPKTGKEAAFTAPLPDDFRAYWESLQG